MKKTRVILVEDDTDDSELFKTFLAHRNDIVLLCIASNGIELIRFLDRMPDDDQLPHLIILDQNMPMMNGKQTLKYLSEHDRYSVIPAVIYSTYADSSLVVDCKKLGAKMVASKPIDEDGYDKMMDNFLEVI